MKRWRQVPFDEQAAHRLAGQLGLPVPVAAVLVGRGCQDPEQAERFLRPRLSDLCDPFQIPGMAEAVCQILEVAHNGGDVVVYGDYDADGVCGAALLADVLNALGVKARTFLPRRRDEGYGLTGKGLSRCLEAGRPELLITVDCGTSSVAEVRRLRADGMRVVVTDHHEPAGAVAEADAVVNPRLGSPEAAQWLAGAGVAFRLCHALVKKSREDGRVARDVDLREWLDVVAIGTIADVVPLVGENRILARHGLRRLSDKPRAGLAALMEAAGLRRGEVSAGRVAYWIAPRLNAAGRMADADTALRLLRESDSSRARELARELDRANRQRQAVENAMLEEAEAQVARSACSPGTFGIVAAGDGWHVGAIGIVAARLCGRYHRPAVVIAFDENGRGRGSCRSVEKVNMVEVLSGCRDALVGYGGHAMAAGLEIERANLEAFVQQFNRLCGERLSGLEDLQCLRVDALADPSEIDGAFLQANRLIQPCGCGNPEPVYAATDVRIVGAPRVLKDRHLKLLVGAGGRNLEAIWFNMAGSGVPAGEVDMAFAVDENWFMGESFLQLRVEDIRPADRASVGELSR